MRETLLLDVPHRQVVFTVPKRLRVFFKHKRWLLGELCRAALRALTRYFEVVAGSALVPGVIAAIQTFGDRINFHPHLHFLVTEGGVDRAGVFHTSRETETMNYLEFIARVTSHIPDKGQVTVRYYGLYANVTGARSARRASRLYESGRAINLLSRKIYYPKADEIKERILDFLTSHELLSIFHITRVPL